MTSLLCRCSLALALTLPLTAFAQLAVVPQPDHARLLSSHDAQAAANKRLVYDFWREILEGGHIELANQYLAESYQQHNPNVATGRAAFVEIFSRLVKPQAIQARVKAPLVSIVAEGDLVVLSFVSELTDPKDPNRKYTTTWFDMFRIEGGKIAEHRDSALKN